MEAHHLSGVEHKLERLIFFSDAVFAIAITLLVIDLHAPHLRFDAGGRDFVQALATMLPSFIGFFVSFFVIGAFWAGHHRGFALAHTWSDRLIAPNLMLLSAIAAMPFFTAFMSANPAGRVPSLAYCGWLIVAGLLNIRVQRLVTSAPVVDPDVPPGMRAFIRRRGFAVVAGGLTGAVLVMVAPYGSLGLVGLATIGLWRRLLTRKSHG